MNDRTSLGDLRHAFIGAWVNYQCRVLLTPPASEALSAINERAAFLEDPEGRAGGLWRRTIAPFGVTWEWTRLEEITRETEVVPAPTDPAEWAAYVERLGAPGPRVRIAFLPDLKDPAWVAAMTGIAPERVAENGPERYLLAVAEFFDRLARGSQRPGTLFIVKSDDQVWSTALYQEISRCYVELPVIIP